MKFPSNLTEGILLKRHNRFLADIVVTQTDKRLMTCLNDSCLKGCDVLGSRIWFSENQKGSAQIVWELSEVNGGHLVAVNKSLSAKLIVEAIDAGVITELQGYSNYLLQEETQGLGGYLEFRAPDEKNCFVYAQDVTFCDEIGRGFFPEDIVPRAAQDLRALIRLVDQGHRGVLFLCVKNTGIQKVFTPHHIDSQYHALLQDALKIGVEVIAYRSDISLCHITLVERTPFVILH